ncbi:ATP-dependent nuclease [Bosea sp. BH3]|uniref:ATP-dependent nuclease n=1 Tax=Bosea sp. BH3 TaxID=2871701 RepID=UPI0021CB2536|nr:ATP-binding protein [Bosea sp. BH3]MCU4178622.1 ATP-binding protein [Bosea sp. BH3]
MNDLSTPPPGGAVIHRLLVRRFRGLKSLVWLPKPGLNVILGAGDSGKTTILDAIALLLNPTNTTLLSDADYWGGRELSSEFLIGAVVSLPPNCGVDSQRAMVWPWAWDGEDARAPKVSEDGADPGLQGPAVYKICVSGNVDLDLTYELRCPNGDIERFSPNLRREIGLVRLSGDDRSDRDLRLVQGSALDRLLSDPGLRARLGGHFSGADLSERLSDDGRQALDDLDTRFKGRALPNDLSLGLNGAQGQSISAFVGLTAAAGAGRLPLSSWGAGTRRLASLAIAQAYRTGCPITLVDEAERGLEPYRQRKLVADLATSSSQVFMTTHSAAALSAAEGASLWHLVAGRITALETPKVTRHQRDDPETFLSRLAIVGEGATEVGFLRAILSRELAVDLLDHGVRLCDGRGNSFALDLLTEMSSAGFNVAGLVDDEGEKTGLWLALKSVMGDRLLQWVGGCTESAVIGALSDDQLEALITDPEGVHTQARLNTLIERITHENASTAFERRDFTTVREAAGDQLRRLVIEAASASPKDTSGEKAKTWKRHGKVWFKTLAGGEELGQKALRLGAMPRLEARLRPLIKAIEAACGPAAPTDQAPFEERA